jgi:hypothetical protein
LIVAVIGDAIFCSRVKIDMGAGDLPAPWVLLFGMNIRSIFAKTNTHRLKHFYPHLLLTTRLAALDYSAKSTPTIRLACATISSQDGKTS